MPHETDFDRNRALSDNYEQRPRWFIPGYDASHAMAAVLLRDRIATVDESSWSARVAASSWRCSRGNAGAGPLPLSIRRPRCYARRKSRLKPRARRIGCLGFRAASRTHPKRHSTLQRPLALHFVPDDGRRLSTLREIHARLKPGAPFLMINGCADRNCARFEDDLRVYAAFARRNGAPADVIDLAVSMLRESVFFVPPEREEALLAQAGFRDVRLFYTGLWIVGWIVRS